MANVLIAEDDPDMRDLIEFIIGSDGHHVTAVSDGRGAWDLLSTQAHDLVIMDRTMPGIDGLELLRRLRERSDLAHLKIILMSGYTEAHHMREGCEAGADAYIAKPFLLHALRGTVSRLLADAAGAPVITRADG